MSELITSQARIPQARIYVCANDSFMSGWGESRDKTNVCIFPCHTREESERIEDILRKRSEMKRVRVCIHKPRLHCAFNTYSLCDPNEWR